jgi:hypothetical protein
MNSDSSASHSAIGPARGLGACWIVYGILRLVMALWLATFTPIATVMFGAILVRVVDPYSLMAAFHFFYLCAIILSVPCGVIGVLAGLALLLGQRSGHGLAVVAAFLSLCDLPLGITLGVYTLVTLLPVRIPAPEQHSVGVVNTHPSPAR